MKRGIEDGCYSKTQVVDEGKKAYVVGRDCDCGPGGSGDRMGMGIVEDSRCDPEHLGMGR